jgi:uracil-xanthine permease
VKGKDKMNEKKQYAKVTELNGIPRLAEALPLALQHVVAMIVGCVTPAIILSGVTGLTPGDQVRLIQASLLISGLATLLQLFPPVRRCGSGLPVIMGASFAHVPLLIALGAQFGLPTILGAQLVGGVIAILVGLFYKKLSRIFTPLVTGTVVFTIGAPDFGSPRNWFLAVLTLVIVIFFNYFTKGFCKLASILIGIICGYAAAFFMGMVSFEGLGDASWFQFTSPLYFGMEFDITAIISMGIMFVVGSLEIMGDFTSTAGGGLNRPVDSEEMCGGILGNGIISILGSLFGGLPTATFSQNVGIVIMTKVVNRAVLGLAATIIVLAGLIPKFSALLTTVPSCVLGGATVSVFAMIAMTGIKLVVKEGLDTRNTAIVGLSVALGIGVIQVADCFALFPEWAKTIFGTSPVVIATITAVTLNLLLPKDLD